MWPVKFNKQKFICNDAMSTQIHFYCCCRKVKNLIGLHEEEDKYYQDEEIPLEKERYCA